MVQWRKMATIGSGRRVTFPSDHPDGDAGGVMFGDPSVTTKGVLVQHEWWGMNKQIVEDAEEIAKDGGFTTLVVDVYRGRLTEDSEEADRWMTNLDYDGAVKDLTAGAKFLFSKGCTKVGVMGFSLGGALSFLAGNIPDVSAVAPFYGIPYWRKGPAYDEMVTIKIPIQGHFGLKDTVKGFSSPEDFYALRDKLHAAGCDFDLRTYDAGHSFTDRYIPGKYNKEATEKSFKATYKFFNEKLQ